MQQRLQTNGIRHLDSSGQQGVFCEKTFRFVLRRERSRSDRTRRPFSLIVLHVPGRQRKNSHLRLLNVLARRIRIMDVIGWVGPGSLGVLLPETSADDGVRFLEKMIPLISHVESCSDINIYTYPEPSESDQNPIRRLAERSAGAGSSLSEILAESPSLPLRLFERAVAGVALLVLSPLFLIIVLSIKVSSPGPVFFRQERVGQKGNPFYCYKFRTMRLLSKTEVHEEYFSYLIQNPVPMKKLDNSGDPRIFPAGHFLRASSLDELPQLFNILKGEMRLVGPRPCTPGELEHYLPWQRARLDALPGLTGLWQVSGKNKTTFDEMIRLDLRYIRDRSVVMDFGIILKTIPVVIGLFVEQHFGADAAAEPLGDMSNIDGGHRAGNAVETS